MKEDNDALKTTTVRMTVTEEEHEAIRWASRHNPDGTTIDQFVRGAIDARMSALFKKSLAALTEEAKNRGKVVQGDLFEEGGF